MVFDRNVSEGYTRLYSCLVKMKRTDKDQEVKDLLNYFNQTRELQKQYFHIFYTTGNYEEFIIKLNMFKDSENKIFNYPGRQRDVVI